MSCTFRSVALSESLFALTGFHSRFRFAVCLAICAAISGSVWAGELSPGPVQVEPSIPYPEKMTFIGLSQSLELAASMGLAASIATRGAVKQYVHDAA
ncbi:MAG TPA: hypothetical protein VN939_07825, partial [Chthoniobacterales bacterium]|nr:hypothetical protein [Chthoniobacterales bacterium]